MLAQFTSGNSVYNGTRTITDGMFQFSNGSKTVLNRWRKEGDVTDIPRADHTDPGGNRRSSTRWLEDGSYLRIKTVTLVLRCAIGYSSEDPGEQPAAVCHGAEPVHLHPLHWY